MDYSIESWTISKLLKHFDDGKLNLNPSYQRNDIWPSTAKKKLIQSVKLGYPLPSFFLHDKGDGYDIVDGQQRTRTFIGYKKKLFNDLTKKFYGSDDQILYDSYKLSITIIHPNSNELGSIEDFYFRVNNFGIRLNRPEIKRAEFSESPFQILIETLADSEEFLILGLFTQKSSDRLNDLDFISELLALMRFGITEKKTAVDKLYNENLNEQQVHNMQVNFRLVLDEILRLNKFYSISETRYKQRNDFYTLFSFLLKHSNEINSELMLYQYKLLILIAEDISPTNDKCWAFQEYATNCVSQSNSKRAREQRLAFFEKILLNKEPKPLTFLSDDTSEFNSLAEILDYYSLSDDSLVVKDGYRIINIDVLNNIKPHIQFL